MALQTSGKLDINLLSLRCMDYSFLFVRSHLPRSKDNYHSTVNSLEDKTRHPQPIFRISAFSNITTMPRSPMSPIFNHSNWDTIDISIDDSITNAPDSPANNTSDMTTSNNLSSGYRYVPANMSHQTQRSPNSNENGDTISQHTDLFPLPPTYSQFHPPYTPSPQPPNYQTFPSFTRTHPDNDSNSSSDCYSDHLDLDDYLAPSPGAVTAPIFSSFPTTNNNPKKSCKPRTPPSLTFFPRPILTPKITPGPPRPVHQSRHLSTLSAKMPLLPLHHDHHNNQVKNVSKSKKVWAQFSCLPFSDTISKERGMWYDDEVEEELEITPSLVQGLDLRCEKQQQQRACHSTWRCVLQFLGMVLLGFLFLGAMLMAGRTLWEFGWGVVAWINGKEAAVEVLAGGRLCSNAHPRFCHLVLGAER
ncbi:hypothetical protein QBC36DRAFT_337384 [Triangularia setosa]|uniref:Uncharacterized protein n=1 Tax=Triangularia setosa TaxID=2587417 RepID=A0AAN7A299_9PEZI|nr:hypothetical protein QBC36DRAFT_337384 [Podospora setosa]